MATASGNGGGGEPDPAVGGRKRQALGDEDDSERPLTLSTLLEALKENREEIVAKVRTDMEGLNTRVSEVEQAMQVHVTHTTRLMQAMTDRHCAMEESVKEVGEKQSSVLQRLELLEGKFAKADFPVSSTRTSDSEAGGQKPALIIGGWDSDQHHEETLRLMRKHMQDLKADLDISQAFVPGLRRGFTIVPLAKAPGETEADQREQRPEGGHRYLFATMSQSPERRKRAQLAGKVKRLIIEEGGDPSRIEVEYGTANLWYNSVKLASGVTSAPSGASVEKAGWVHLGNLTRQIGGSEDAVTTRWGDLRKALM
ncbi:unnamed protein product [Symbiodinium sp. CCMP2456]|nr:unnamed protein product [Symbiodinium sp. CCMP2456]